MRLLFLVLMIGCEGLDYEILNTCVAEGELIACPLGRTHSEAGDLCDDLGGELPRVSSLEEQHELAAFGEKSFDVWWSGHNGTSYECPAMGSGNGSSAPWDCEDLLPVVCQLRD